MFGRNGKEIPGVYDPLTAVPDGMQPRFRVINPHIDISKVVTFGINGNRLIDQGVNKQRVVSVFPSSYTLEEANKVVEELNVQKGWKGYIPWNRARVIPDKM
jgi:hypothetical protein